MVFLIWRWSGLPAAIFRLAGHPSADRNRIDSGGRWRPAARYLSSSANSPGAWRWVAWYCCCRRCGILNYQRFGQAELHAVVRRLRALRTADAIRLGPGATTRRSISGPFQPVEAIKILAGVLPGGSISRGLGTVARSAGKGLVPRWIGDCRAFARPAGNIRGRAGAGRSSFY